MKKLIKVTSLLVFNGLLMTGIMTGAVYLILLILL